MTRYIEAFSWTETVDEFVRAVVTESPLLNVCSGRSGWGDVTVDLFERADVRADWGGPWPFRSDTFGAVFADPPWDSGHKAKVAGYVREALRVAATAYLMAPWLYGAGWAVPDRVWVRHFPGIHAPILLTRYRRADPTMHLPFDDQP